VKELQPLSDLIPGWPQNGPVDGKELIFADNSDLETLGLTDEQHELVVALRQHFRSAAAARGASAQLSNAPMVVRALDTGDIRPRWGKWLTIVLDRHNRRCFSGRRDGTSRTVVRMNTFVPDPDELPSLPEGGKYLLLRGSSPDVLDIDDVRVRLGTLASSVPLADVVFRISGSHGAAPTTWSLREKTGVCSGAPVPFPNEAALKEVDLWS
jgi:hypothetical protein